MAARPLSPLEQRPPVRDRGQSRAAGRQARANTRVPAQGRGRGGRAGAGAARRARRLQRRRERSGRCGAGASERVPAVADRVRAVAARRHADRDQAACVRALDQLGARAVAGRNGPRAGAGPDRDPRPGLPARAPRRAAAGQGIRRRWPRARRAARPAEGAARAGRRGQWLQQLGDLHRAQRIRRRPAGRGSAPAAQHARDLVPGIARGWRALRARRIAARDPRDLHGSQQRRRLDVHEHDGRRPGPLRGADRG